MWAWRRPTRWGAWRPASWRRGSASSSPGQSLNGGDTPMRLEGHQKRLTIFVGESDHHGHTPLATEIVQRAHAAGLAGASVFRGVEGYGASNHIHTTRILSLSDDLPMAVVIIDVEERIRAFLDELDELITEGLVIVDDVEVVKYVGRGSGTEA